MININSGQINPTWSGSLSNGWETMKRYFLPLLLVIIICAIVDWPLHLFSRNNKGEYTSLRIFLEFLVLAYWVLFYPVIKYSADLLFIRAVRKETFDVKDIIIGFKNYLNIVLAHLFATALIGIAFIALIIPGIIVACRLVFVPYLVMDKGLDPIAAVEGSWKMTKGYGWRIFFLAFTSIFIFFAGLICLIVGIFPALMWINASFASLYQAILNETDNAFPSAVTEEPEI
jgi:uncharacterized membrane protein